MFSGVVKAALGGAGIITSLFILFPVVTPHHKTKTYALRREVKKGPLWGPSAGSFNFPALPQILGPKNLCERSEQKTGTSNTRLLVPNLRKPCPFGKLAAMQIEGSKITSNPCTDVQSSQHCTDVRDWDYSRVFIDWVTIREPNNTDMPPVNAGAIVKLDKQGEIVYITPTTKSIEGSYSTIARVRVTDTYREISLNPSRFSRPDNLFGYRLPDAVRVVNQMLRSIEQPPLTAEYYFTRLDVTLNVSTGSAGNLEAYLRDLRKRTLPRMKTRAYEGSVIYKNKSKSITVYAKHAEMRNHKSQYLDERPYREKVAADCEKNGVARIELRLGRLWLNRNNLSKPKLHSELVQVFKREVFKMQKQAKEEATDMLTPTELGTLLMWQNGYYVKDVLAKNTYYTRRNSIRQKTGYDIGAEPPLRFKPKQNTYRTESYVPPSWYKMPKVLEAD